MSYNPANIFIPANADSFEIAPSTDGMNEYYQEGKSVREELPVLPHPNPLYSDNENLMAKAPDVATTDIITKESNLPSEEKNTRPERIVLFGGELDYNTVNDKVWELTQDQTWKEFTELPQDMQCSHTAVCTTPDGFIIVGGIKDECSKDTCYQFIACYSTWTKMSNMPTARYCAGAVAVANDAYVIGGNEHGRNTSIVEIYTPCHTSNVITSNIRHLEE